ncbi:MAG: thioredoxin family protein [Bacteroidales bacterium]|jgi:thiol:disulfide interchange protein DsbD|nr:thioredoxin family protein [Bacteroidales bacterium]
MRNRFSGPASPAIKFLAVVAALLVSVAAFAQDASVKWKIASEQLSDETFKITFSGKIEDGKHIYGINPGIGNPVEVEYSTPVTAGPLEEVTKPQPYKEDLVFFREAVFSQEVTAEPGTEVEGVITWQACTEDMCGFPEELEFTVTLGASDAAAHQTAIGDPERGSQDRKGLWALIIEAILWGFAMLLTPCVFPMIPMTVSFFLKGSENAHQGRFKAFMYGLFIVLLYTVPISIIIGLTRLLGGETVTADIFNWLATHWLPNLVFFIVFMVFAASFFGAFEIVLPSSWQNKSDANSGKKGLAGVFFMALTLVLVSFSCTGPIVGSVLIKSTQGEFWTPMVTMLAFSVAFALPFTVFALFPQLLKKMKSGSWLNSVKVVMGFIEVAFGFKFLSVADQTYHWGLLDREVYLAIWIVVFALLGFYLLGKIRFTHDEPVEKIGVTRLTLAIAVFSFVVYMVPGMFGAPLKALSGYLPPISTQDFVIANYAEGQVAGTASATPADPNRYGLHIAHNLPGYFTLEEGLAASKASGKPVFVDVTGHGCTNCREMEARVWSDPEVLQRLRDNFEIVALYTDDKQKLPESEWFTTPAGKTLKTLGSVNSYIARTRFEVNAQPNYLILSPEGEILAGPRGYNLSIPGFIQFLDSGLSF